MPTAETVKAQLQADIAAANDVTGKQDATMHDAVASLIEGFGGGEVLPEAAGLNEFPEEAYSVNGADLTAVGEAIAEKAGVEKPTFPDGWKDAVEGIVGVKNLGNHKFVIASDLISVEGCEEATQTFTLDGVSDFLSNEKGFLVAYTEYLDEYTEGPWIAKTLQIGIFPLTLTSGKNKFYMTYPVYAAMNNKAFRVNSSYGLHVSIEDAVITIAPRPYSSLTHPVKAGNYRTTFYSLEV